MQPKYDPPTLLPLEYRNRQGEWMGTGTVYSTREDANRAMERVAHQGLSDRYRIGTPILPKRS